MRKFIFGLMLLMLNSVNIFAVEHSNGDYVTSDFGKGSYWSGIIQNTSNKNYQVKLTEVEVKGFKNYTSGVINPLNLYDIID